ncbi:biotin--[acetyl-CoA-carboxylase] ligase [Roseateles sp.]|uniref:biotin--[acetyl-CoA-carboxylase] ligase n=1 Tax=Roseateles sp. TaxID=1971397 RepID=UPI00286C4612|nr:biotin--[acetyl-CoA-carboxylase] ligase [Roseateles sp.]
MKNNHQSWQVEDLYEALLPLLPGISIEVLARAESTNSALLDRIKSEARSGAPQPYGRRAHDMQPCLLVAEHQTHGRGRLGRAWLSAPESSLTFSLALNLAPVDWSGLSLAVGCAIAETLEPGASLPRLTLKWPNDIWLDGRKLGGILIETVSAGAGRIAVIGVGLNIKELNEGQDGPDAAVQFSTGFAALNELRPDCTAPSTLALIAPALLQCLLDFEQNGFAAWRQRYARRDLTLDHSVSAGDVYGVSRGVNEQGELLLQTPQGLVAISGGEVSVRLAATDSSAPLRQES